jgi:murein DD-endopeptidase MepM/ murein hydrolase activator NlpD
MRRMLTFLAAFGLLLVLDSARAVEIRFYPKQVRSYELDATRNIRSVVLQNMAIVNDSKADVTVLEVVIEVLDRGVAYESRTLRTPELDRAATAGANLQASGMLGTLAFQFGGAALLPKGTTLSATRVLKPDAALLLMHQVLTFDGKRDSVRVNVRTLTGMNEASVFILNNASSTGFALPFDGTWHDGAAPSLHTHHRWAVPEEFAHDFTRIGANGLAYSGDGTKLADYYAYGQPVLAAADGQVIAVLNDEPEDASLLQRPGEPLDAYVKRIVERQNQQLARGARGIVGNHVLIQHGQEYSLYAHLQPGSVKVKTFETVTRGQPIALVGSSGSSTEPHLHFHVCDGPDVLVCAGIPVRFENVEIYGALQPRHLQSGDLVRNRK